MALGTIAIVLACGGGRFGAGDPEPAPTDEGGSPNDGGKSGSADAGGGVGSGGEADGAAGEESTTAGGAGTDGGSATTGGSGSGAGGSAAGAAGGPPTPVFTMSRLVDDMEDGNATLLASNGDWFVLKDESNGTITPAKGEPFTMSSLMPARGQSTKAAAVTVSGFTGLGAAFGFDFSYAMGVRQPIDLKEALGVRFWAKASKATTVVLQLPNADTDKLGGKCSGTGTNACDAHWSKPFPVGTSWTETTIAFADLSQTLSGRHVPSFDKQHVFSAFFVIGANQALTLWVDDLALVH